MSGVGSRQTRKQRRARRTRAKRQESASSVWRVGRKLLLSVALVIALVGAVASVFANEDALIILFCLLALLLYAALRREVAK